MALEIEITSPKDVLSNRVCYVILPQGWKDEGADWMRAEADRSGWTFVGVLGADWNDDLTPWPAPGMFRRQKPFGGKAEAFLARLTGEVIPRAEAGMQVEMRAIAGISLSGLFAVWAALNCEAFDSVGCVSASFWYDGFSAWVTALPRENTYLKKAFVLLGAKEKNSKDERLAGVETCTELIIKELRDRGVRVEYVLDEGTHFSPARPRLEVLGKHLFCE